jgi:hypothetical protein
MIGEWPGVRPLPCCHERPDRAGARHRRAMPPARQLHPAIRPVSEEYFDKYLFESDPVLLQRVVACMKHLVPAGTGLLGGLELGGVPLATLLSQATGIPALFVRKQAKAYGTRRIAEGGRVPQLAAQAADGVGERVGVLVPHLLPFILGVAEVLPFGAAERLLRVTPVAAFAIQQSVPAYSQVTANYAPPIYFPLSPWAGFGVLCGYAALALGLAVFLLRRRDA